MLVDATRLGPDAPSVTLHVAQRLKSDILNAHFRPGAKLLLKVLVDRYQASVVPIREALVLLCGIGLVVFESQRGFRVAPISRREFLDLGETRRRLEVLALTLSIERGDAAWEGGAIAALERFQGVAQKVGDDGPIREGWEGCHRNFHVALLAGCGSPCLLSLCEQLHDRFDRYRRLMLASKSYMAGVAGDHEEILKAAIRRDETTAVALLESHIDAISEVILGEYDHQIGL